MALALRRRWALAAASTSIPHLRPAASAPTSGPIPLAPLVSRPSLPRLWLLLPGAAAGFRSTATAAQRGGNYGAEDSKISPDEILFEGCDYKHGLITMEFPDPKPFRVEMIETYLQTLAKVVGSYEAAKKRMFAFSTTTYQAGQDGRGRGYGLPDGSQGQTPQYQGRVNPAKQDQGYYNPQERRNFSQGQGGGLRPGGPSAPGAYGQPSTPGNYGHSPSSTYGGGNQGVPDVNPSYGGDNRQGSGPAAYGGDNWQRGSDQYPNPGGGQGNWQGRQ